LSMNFGGPARARTTGPGVRSRRRESIHDRRPVLADLNLRDEHPHDLLALVPRKLLETRRDARAEVFKASDDRTQLATLIELALHLLQLKLRAVDASVDCAASTLHVLKRNGTDLIGVDQTLEGLVLSVDETRGFVALHFSGAPPGAAGLHPPRPFRLRTLRVFH